MKREQLLTLLTSTTSGESKPLSGGGMLVGHVPTVAPLAYLHSVFAPLTDEECDALENELSHALPLGYREVLLETNGLKLFVSTIAIFGKREGAGRSVDSSRQPYSVVTANTLERPKSLDDEELIVGVFSFDGSLVTMKASSPRVFWRSPDGLQLNRAWETMDQFLLEETVRLARLLGPSYEGLRVGNVVYTLPDHGGSARLN